MTALTPITIAEGDGIGPEIMSATLSILKAAGAALDFETVEIGEKVYLKGHETGIEQAAWDSIRRTRVLLKAPMTTPQGGGYKSLNVTIRTTLGLYANVRPCISYAPFIRTKHPGMNVVIIRENEEDLYTGIEYHQTADSYHAIKLMSRQGCERIIRYAFEYARQCGRKRVTAFTKDNILKLSDGLFHKVFAEIATQYSDIENEHWIVDIGAAKLADTPEAFDVIVLPNLYGDILSDVAAQIAGSVGMAGSANIGQQGAMFEAIHGSAPKHTGQNIANPSGLLHAAIMMLVHVQQPAVAACIHNAWLKTIEEGIHTYDIFDAQSSREKVGTKEFAAAVIKRLGQNPSQLPPIVYKNSQQAAAPLSPLVAPGCAKKTLVGVDVFLEWREDATLLASELQRAVHGFTLTMISNRGVRVWPQGHSETFCIDLWRCRFLNPSPSSLSAKEIIQLLTQLHAQGFEIVKTENLYDFNGVSGFSK